MLRMSGSTVRNHSYLLSTLEMGEPQLADGPRLLSVDFFHQDQQCKVGRAGREGCAQ